MLVSYFPGQQGNNGNEITGVIDRTVTRLNDRNGTITSIRQSAFYSCTELSTASFPSCRSIQSSAFYNCTSLASLYLMSSSVVSLGSSNAFANTPMTSSRYLSVFGSIYVPSSCLSSYQTATNWSTFSSRFVGI